MVHISCMIAIILYKKFSLKIAEGKTSYTVDGEKRKKGIAAGYPIKTS